MFGRKPQKTDAGTVVSVVAAALRRDIAFGDLPPDAKLKIETLRSRYGGSNHSVREALTQLVSEGLVESTAQRGFRVASATAADLQDIIRLRSELEPIALTWSMQKSDVSWEGRLVAGLHALTRATEALLDDPDGAVMAWDEAARGLHQGLIEGCGSPRMIRAVSQLYDQSRRFRLAALREGRCDPQALCGLRRELVDAILAKDPDTAVERLVAEIRHDLDGSAGRNS